MQQQASRALLEQARDKFNAGDYTAAKETLQQLHATERSLQLNRMVIDLELGNSDINEIVLKKMTDMLTAINIELYEENRPREITFIAHQMLYSNIVMLANQMGKGSLAELITLEALELYHILTAKTSLALIYQNLKKFLVQNRLSSCFELIEKFQKVIAHCRTLGKQEERYKIMINAMFIKALLKLSMIHEGQALFMLKFEEGDIEKFTTEDRNSRFKRKTPVKYDDVIRFLHAEIEFFNANYQKSINLLSIYLIPTESNRERVYAENNLGISLCMAGKCPTGQRILSSNCETLFKIASSPKKVNPEVLDLFQRSRENILLAHLHSRQASHTTSHFNVDGDMKCYNQMKNMDEGMSYRLEYRKGQACLNLYHSLLDKSHRKLPWEEIHDSYDNVYYHPNQPYFQFKGRNKNSYLANKKPVYRRYVLNQWNDNPSEEQVDKDINRRKFEKQAHSLKLKELLFSAEKSFQKSLLILEKEESKNVQISGSEKDMAKTINQKLYHEYNRFRASLLCLLAYVAVCQCKWAHVVNYAEEFEKKKCYQSSSEDSYNIEMYRVEALCEMDRIGDAYDSIHKLVNSNMNRGENFNTRDGSNLYNCNMEKGMSQQVNFLYNIAVLHSRDNRIPEVYQAVQKLFENLKVNPVHSIINLPLSMAELLIHYNLRIQNHAAVLQIIKHRRILSMAPNKTILNITK